MAETEQRKLGVRFILKPLDGIRKAGEKANGCEEGLATSIPGLKVRNRLASDSSEMCARYNCTKVSTENRTKKKTRTTSVYSKLSRLKNMDYIKERNQGGDVYLA